MADVVVEPAKPEPVPSGRWVPTRKVGGGVVVGTPYGIIAVWALQSVLGPTHPIPAEVAVAIGSAISGIVAYFIPSKD